MTKTILLADDSVTIQKVVELTFMDGDYHVIAVGNGAEAANRLAEVSPDVVIADVHMPGLNGFELCRRVKEWRSTTPVLLLVGTFEPFDREQFAASGAEGQLKKPFDSQELQRQVDELLSSAAAPSDASGTAATAAGEPDWMAGAGESELPPQTADTWHSGTAGWQEEAPMEPLRDNNEGAPDVGRRAQAAAFGWNEPAPEPAAPASWLDTRTAKISDEMMRSAVAGVDAVRTPLETPVDEPPAAEAPAMPAAAAPTSGPAPAERELSDADIERIAQRVAAILGERVVRDISWEVIPDLAEVIIKDRIRELEAQVE